MQTNAAAQGIELVIGKADQVQLDETFFGAMILATIVSRRGSAPRAAGSKMLVRKDGSILETVGGGSAEAEVIEYAKHLLREGITAAEVRHLGLAVSPEEDGMVCGGEIEVLLETV